MDKAIVGKCGLCGGTVTRPVVWHGIYPPVSKCETCGATVNGAANLPTLPMNPRGETPNRSQRLNHALQGAVWAVLGFFALGCSPVNGQTPTIAERKTALVNYVNASTDTRVGQIENALAPLGYVPPTGPVDPPPVSDRTLIWSTTHESGNLSTWNFGRTAAYDSGNGKTSLVQISNAKSGLWALKQTVTADDSSGARCFITADKDNKALPHRLYMTAWVYVPKQIAVGSWWNHMQLKERQSVGTSSFVNPTLHLSIGRDSGGMYQRIYNWIPGQKVYYNQPGVKTYIPIAKWTKIEWYVDSRVSGGSTWLKQDDKLIIERTGIKTISSDSYVLNWSVNCYGGTGPGQVTYYWDDCTLETPK